MRTLKVVSRSFPIKLTATLVLTVMLGALISAVFFYFYADRALGESYAQRLFNLSEFKYEVLRSSLYIYLLFGVAVLTAIILMSTYYSHRVTGPLMRIKIFAEEMKRGNFGIDVKFRSEDVIHPVAEAADEFSKRYGELYTGLNELVDEMQKDASELKEAIQRGDSEKVDSLRKKVADAAEELDKRMLEVKT